MRIITSGPSFIDIDAYAGCIAYAELLQLQGVSAHAVSTAPWNSSITPTVRAWGGPLVSRYTAAPTDTFTLIDVSDPGFFDKLVDLDRVDEIIDHHSGFEAQWQAKLGDKAHIELVGAAATLVYECWKTAGLLDKISHISAGLLATAILDNTLNFGAHITSDRDRAAYADLATRGELPPDWPAQYFAECQTGIMQDVAAALRGDTKTIAYPGQATPLRVGQLAVWDGRAIREGQLDLLDQVMAESGADWYINLIGLSEGASHFVCPSPGVQAWLSGLLGVKFEGNVAAAGRMWLRKEIMQQAEKTL